MRADLVQFIKVIGFPPNIWIPNLNLVGVRDYFDGPKSFILLKNDHRNLQIQIKNSNFGREANLSTKLYWVRAHMRN